MGEGSPTKIHNRQKGTLILTYLLEDIGHRPSDVPDMPLSLIDSPPWIYTGIGPVESTTFFCYSAGNERITPKQTSRMVCFKGIPFRFSQFPIAPASSAEPLGISLNVARPAPLRNRIGASCTARRKRAFALHLTQSLWVERRRILVSACFVILYCHFPFCSLNMDEFWFRFVLILRFHYVPKGQLGFGVWAKMADLGNPPVHVFHGPEKWGLGNH